MKKFFLSFMALTATMVVNAETSPLWMRFPALSPDGLPSHIKATFSLYLRREVLHGN